MEEFNDTVDFFYWVGQDPQILNLLLNVREVQEKHLMKHNFQL